MALREEAAALSESSYSPTEPPASIRSSSDTFVDLPDRHDAEADDGERRPVPTSKDRKSPLAAFDDGVGRSRPTFIDLSELESETPEPVIDLTDEAVGPAEAAARDPEDESLKADPWA